jgi:transcriptional regulator with XRE-family HTH domain
LTFPGAQRKLLRMARASTARKEAPPIVIRIESARRAFPSDSAIADAIGVNRSQVRRWREGRTEPSPEAADRLVGLDAVVELLSGYLEPASIRKWLEGFNAHLGNRRPIDVLREGNLSEVVAAVQALKSGAYA